MTVQVKIVKDSISEKGVRLTTFQLKYWRAIHAELMTHRVFSRNASSSRAIPVSKMLKQVWNEPAGPIHWGDNQPGMQADNSLIGVRLKAAKFLWRLAAKLACCVAWGMIKVNLHKQVANRLLEPFGYISVVVTATEFDNFFHLRAHPDAQPEIQELAEEMLNRYNSYKPTLLKEGQWHLPYISEDEFNIYTIEDLQKMSAARCARVSYLTHDNMRPSYAKDIELHDRLVASVPAHMSPTEHQATPANDSGFHKNFRGWKQYREVVEQRHKNGGR